MGASEILDGISKSLIDDGSTDFIEVHKWVNILNNVLSVALGYILVALLIGISLIIVLEVLYINFPAVQNRMDRQTDNEGRKSKILGVFLRDARRAIIESNTINTGQSANTVYLKIKIKTIIVAFIIIGLLINYNVVLSFLTKQLSNILRAFGL